MNKTALHLLLLEKLEADLEISRRAAQTAYETATHEENIAENKYDTLGLEASYLAAGQARRAEEIRQSLKSCQAMTLTAHHQERGIEVGDAVRLEAQNGSEQWLFLAPEAAGLKIRLGQQTVTVITPRAPLGAAVLGKQEGDEVQLNLGASTQRFTVCEIY